MGKILVHSIEGLFYVVLASLVVGALILFIMSFLPKKNEEIDKYPSLTKGKWFTRDPTFTDATLLASATAPYDIQSEEVTATIGIYHGERIVVDYFCSDICPNYTTRIIHFDVPKDKTCSTINGVEMFQEGSGWGDGSGLYCFPKIISDNWRKYLAAATIRSH